MARQQIVVTVDAEGGLEIEAQGFVGGACVQATKDLERALGMPQGNRRFKPEYAQAVQSVKAGQQ